MRLTYDPNEILWYVMSSPFRREMKAKALLDAHQIENFIPMKKRLDYSIKEKSFIMAVFLNDNKFPDLLLLG